MEKFVALSLSGLTLGAIYTLVALGILIMFKATGVVNAAQFGLVALGGYFGYWTQSTLKLPLLLGYLVVLVVMAFVGVVLERLAYAPLRTRAPDTVLLSTLAVGFAIEGIIVLWQGAQLRSLPSIVGLGTTDILGANVPDHSLFVIAVTAGAVALLALLFNRTPFGRQVRALAADRDTARLQGIAVNRLSLATFALASAMAGLAGVLLAPVTSLTPTDGVHPDAVRLRRCHHRRLRSALGSRAGVRAAGAVRTAWRRLHRQRHSRGVPLRGNAVGHRT